MIDVWKKIYYGPDSEKGEGPCAYITLNSIESGYLWLNDHPDQNELYSFMVNKKEIRGLINALEVLEKLL